MSRVVISIFMTCVLALPGNLISKEAKKAAKAIILRGNVHAQNKDGSVVKIKKGDWIFEGAKVKTANKSFVKLVFIDKSQMSIGPKSLMHVESFPKKKAGVINLLRGNVRAKVSKNYMEMDKSKSKLYIKTKTAAMGVRGTDFRVLYNPKNKVTNLLTFEGNVRMANFNKGTARVNRNAIENALARKSAVSVRAGQFSMVNKAEKAPNAPTKISPKQLQSLSKNEFGMKTSEAARNKEKKGKDKKKYRGTMPKGVDPKAFSNNSKEMEKQLAGTVGKGTAKDIIKATGVELAKERSSENSALNRGKGAPVPGGYIDEATALYVPPPKNSEYDENADVFIPPPSIGSVDGESGTYVPPAGYELVHTGDFVAVDNTGSRDPASTGPEPASVAGDDAPPASVMPTEGEVVQDPLAPQVNDPCVINPVLCQQQEQFNNAPPPPLPSGTTGSRTRFQLGND